jgi:L-amino acid N-acyltransferase YncA
MARHDPSSNAALSNDLHIRRATENDAQRIAEIYNWYVLNTAATFEIAPVDPAEMSRRIQEKLAKHDWLVGELRSRPVNESSHRVVGYAYCGPFRPRAAYSHTVESSVWVDREHPGKGFGKALYSALIASVANKGFREVVGVIALPNPASIALHRAVGFQEVGVLRRVGYKFARYIDVGVWQLPVGNHHPQQR